MGNISRRLALALPVLGYIASFTRALAQPKAKAPDTDWRNYAGDLASTRYSPVDQIGPDNFKYARSGLAGRHQPLRPASRIRSAGHAPGGQGQDVLHRRHPAQRGVSMTPPPAKCCGFITRTRASGAEGAAPGVRPRPGLLDRRSGGTHPLCHDWLSPDRAGRQDWPPIPDSARTALSISAER